MKSVKTFILLLTALVMIAALAVGVLFATGTFHITEGKDGKAQVVAPYSWRNPDAPKETFTVKNQAGKDVQYHVPGPGMMAEPVDVANGEAVKYFAPEPKNPVTDAVCSDQKLGEAHPEPGQWVIPSLADPDTGQQLTGSFHDGSFEVLPSAPEGVRDTLSEPVGAGAGVSTLAGHVNQDWPSGALSNWGELHEISACAHIYVGGAGGVVFEYAVDNIGLIPQGDVAGDARLWRHDGAPGVNFLTCAGEFVGDTGTDSAGSSFDFSYTHNLWVGAYLLQ